MAAIYDPGPDDPPRDSEIDEFRTLRRRRRGLWVLFLTYLPAAAGAWLVQARLLGVVTIGWMVAFAVASTGPRRDLASEERPMRLFFRYARHKAGAAETPCALESGG